MTLEGRDNDFVVSMCVDSDSMCVCYRHRLRPDAQNIGPSKAAIAGGIAGGAAAIGLVLYFTLRKAPSITGCVQSVDGEVSLTDEKDHRPYAITGKSPDLKAGRRVRLRGKKIQGNDGRFTFRTKKIDHDYGSCGT